MKRYFDRYRIGQSKNPATSRRRVITRRLRCEFLEQRRVLATFGTPWPDARSLQVSFPTDQAQIGGYSNSIREVFDQVADRREWQAAALRAFQTWAVQTNINIGLTTDRGDSFGTVGLTSNDPRFGEFRIGAFPQEGVLANALPFQANSGTWAGDVLLNTHTNYFLGDWESDQFDIPDANEKGPAVELFSVLLHEAGNALGLADVNRPGTVMHGTYLGPLGELKAMDKRSIRDLYGGPRQDVYEPTPNNRRADATRIEYPHDFDASEPLAIRGSLNTKSDKDFYRFQPLAGAEKVTVRLKASEISLVKAKLIVMDRQGNVIADAKADSLFENDLQLEIGSLKDHRHLFIQVERNTDDVFAIGDYQIELDYRDPSMQPPLEPILFDADEDDDDDDDELVFDPEQSVDAIFSNVGIIDFESGLNDTIATSSSMETAIGFVQGTRYETVGSLVAGDVDHYSFTAPWLNSPLLKVDIEGVGFDSPLLRADILNEAGERLTQARAKPRPDGSVSFEIDNPTPGARYIIRVAADPTATVQIGNYVVTVDAATDAVHLDQLLSGTVVPNAENWSRVNVRKTQLFRFDLQSNSANANRGVAVTAYNARTGDIVFSIVAAGDSLQIDYQWLQQGDYYMRVTPIAREGFGVGPVSYQLAADGISDDQGPLPVDPSDPYGGTLDPFDPDGPNEPPEIWPVSDPYGGNPFNPNGTPPPQGGYIQPPDPPYNPWYDDDYYSYYFGYYG